MTIDGVINYIQFISKLYLNLNYIWSADDLESR